MTETLESQIKRLADFIMHNVPGEPSRSEGAVDTAIRLLGDTTALRGQVEDAHHEGFGAGVEWADRTTSEAELTALREERDEALAKVERLNTWEARDIAVAHLRAVASDLRARLADVEAERDKLEAQLLRARHNARTWKEQADLLVTAARAALLALEGMPLSLPRQGGKTALFEAYWGLRNALPPEGPAPATPPTDSKEDDR